MLKNKYLIFIGLGTAAVIALFLILKEMNTPSVTPPANINPDTLAGIQAGEAPWPAQIERLRERLSQIGLPALAAEGSVLHIHQHLDIFINGQALAIPPEIGVNEAAGFISPVHTHGPDAIIHVESPRVETFTLGQFFDVWGVRFTNQCLGSYCSEGDRTLKVYINGDLYKDDPRQIKLKERQQIVVIYGRADESPKPIPSSYNFPPNL